MTGTEKASYDRAIVEASRLISPAQISLLKLSVSLHVYSPKIEMYSQMALERGLNCPAAVDVAGTIVCSVDKIEEAVNQVLVRKHNDNLSVVYLGFKLYNFFL